MIFRRTSHRDFRSRQARITLNLTSMIDAVFLLLAYFLLTTTMIRPEDRLTPNLAVERAVVGEASDFEPQVVEVVIVGDGPRYRLGGRLFEARDALTETLRDLPKEAGLLVRVADDAPVGFAAAALQAGRDAGFEQVTYVPMR